MLKSFPQYRFLVTCLVVSGTILGYTFWGWWNIQRFDNGLTPISLAMGIDHMAPFFPPAIWIYILYYPLTIFSGFCCKTRGQIHQLALTFIVVNLVGWGFWYAWPVRMVFPTITCSAISCQFLQHIYTIDQGVNVFPSMHVTHSLLVTIALVKFKHPLRFISGMIAVGIIFATVLIRQHYAVDAMAGIALAFSGWYVAEYVLASFSNDSEQVESRSRSY